MGGIPVDEVNLALHLLLYRREIKMAQADIWILAEAQCHSP